MPGDASSIYEAAEPGFACVGLNSILRFVATPIANFTCGRTHPVSRAGGNWARMRDGRIIGRSGYCGVFLCDTCLREWTAVRVFFPNQDCGVPLRA
jgi:hypothetical protein